MLLCLPPLWGASQSYFMAPPSNKRTAHATRDLCFALPQLRYAGLVTLKRQSASSHLWDCDAGGAAGCHPEMSRQCHQAASEVGAAWAVPREADQHLVRRELLDTLPWVL